MTELRQSRLRRIKTVSRILKTVAFAAVAVFTVLYILAFTLSEGITAVVHAVAGRGAPASLGGGDIAVLFIIGAVPFGLFLAAISSAGQLFRVFEQGRILDPLAGTLVSRIGLFVVASEFASILAEPVATAYMTAQSGVGTGTFTLSSTNLAAFMLGAIIIVIGWVIAEAAEVAEDNRQII